jgi:hypothetical protein
MSAAVSTSPNYNWRELYRSAILEPDSNKVPDLIAQAEQEIIQRARQLFQEAGNNLAEEHALDSAIRSLHLFRSTFKKGAASCLHEAYSLPHARVDSK